jgi:hypothetical protein
MDNLVPLLAGRGRPGSIGTHRRGTFVASHSQLWFAQLEDDPRKSLERIYRIDRLRSFLPLTSHFLLLLVTSATGHLLQMFGIPFTLHIDF